MRVSVRASTQCYNIHGLTVACDFALPCSKSQVPGVQPDLVVAAAEQWLLPASLVARSGERVTMGSDGPGPTVASNSDGTWIRFHKCCEFFCDPQGRVAYRTHPAAEPKLAEVLLPNAVIGVLLGLRSIPMLHASAVALPRQSQGLPNRRAAIAIVGPSGAGKSTLAAALCAQGAELIADDSLRLKRNDAEVWALPGATELRLRAGSSHLAAALNGPQRTTVDGRLGVMLSSSTDAVRLRAVILPELVDELTQPVQPMLLHGQDALIALLGNLRIADWGPSVMSQLLPELARVARGVRVWRVKLLRGFHQQLLYREQLLELALTITADADQLVSESP